MNHCTLAVFHRSHFGSRYQSGRCALRSPFSKPCKFESPSCHFSFPFEKAVKTVCFYGLAKSRRVSTNVKKTPAAATQRKLKMIPVRIRFESDSNRIRIGFESGRIPVRFDYSIPTQFLPNSYSIPPFILGKIVCTSRFGQMNLSWGEYICKRTRELLLCHSNQDGLPMDKKIVYSSRFVRVILAQGPC